MPLTTDQLLTVVALLFGLITVIIGLGRLIVAIHPIWSERKSRRQLLQKFARGPFDPDTIVGGTKYYIRPKFSNIDPAQEPEIRHAAVVAEAEFFPAIDRFLSDEAPSRRHLIVLADSGMGKTSLLLNYWAYNRRKKRKRRHDIVLVPLGIPNADELIQQVPDRGDKTIFLDAFDEDSKAIDDHRGRVHELMELCREFRRVVITCRTQFFSREQEIPVETGIVRIGPRPAKEGRVYEFRKLYLSPFTDADVERYIRKRYPRWRWRDREKARRVAKRIPLLSVRPMLLAHIPDLLEESADIDTVSSLYEAMVSAWIEREAAWTDKEKLRELSERLALDLYSKREERGMERVPKDELEALAAHWSINLPSWQLTGRSLLNRDALGNLKFAHRSIMEYLAVRRLVGHASGGRVELTDMMAVFAAEAVHAEGADRFSELRGEHVGDRFLLVGKHAASGIELVWIPPGTFTMGSAADDRRAGKDERPAHQVTLSHGFWLGKTPVTNAQYRQLKPDHQGQDDLPVVGVSWSDAKEFCRHFSFRLPTEAEWEYACRAGTTTPWSFGDDERELGRYAWYKANSGGRAHPVGQKEPNPWGLYDMHGNVWEWVEDWYGPYSANPQTDPTGPTSGEGRVSRGGSFWLGAGWARAACRDFGGPGIWDGHRGFRVVLPGAPSR